ncbi:MAG: tetratricopeptide repeat protein, partial [Planctomycetota bacterium]
MVRQTSRAFDTMQEATSVTAVSNRADLLRRLEVFRISHESLVRFAEQSADDRERQFQVASSHQRIGEILFALGSIHEALAELTKACAICQELHEQDPSDQRVLYKLVVLHDNLGTIHRDSGNLPAALQSFLECRRLLESLCKQSDAKATWLSDLAAVCDRLGTVYRLQSKLADALKLFNE